MPLLQVESEATEPHLHQADVPSLRADGGVPTACEDLHQQGIQLQRVPSEVCLQQRPMPKLLGGPSEQETVEIAG